MYDILFDKGERDYAANREQGDVQRFLPVEPGFYPAVIKDIKVKEWLMSGGKYKSNRTDGKWNTVSLTPRFILLNEAGTEISRQDFILFNLDETGRPVRQDGDTKQSPVWGGQNGAQFMLQACGFFQQTAAGVSLKFKPEAVKSVCVVLRVDTGAYQKAGKTASPEEYKSMLDISGTLANYNKEHATAFKPKNMITGFYAINTGQIKEHNLVLNNGIVFQDEYSAKAYDAAMSGKGKPVKKQW